MITEPKGRDDMRGHPLPDPPYRDRVDQVLTGTAPAEGRIDEHTVITHIAKLTRRQNTGSGNPRYRLLTRHGVFETADDSQVGHVIEVSWTVRPRPMMALTLDDGGKVIGIAPVAAGAS